MKRMAALVVVVAACAGSREVSKLRYTSTDCPDPSGCEVKPGDNGFQPPDEAHDQVADAAAPAEAPSCTTVAIALTALELGNYTTEETEDERPVLVAKHRASCEAAKLDAKETACLSTVTETKHVGYCTKKMGAPTQKVWILDALECRDLMTKLRPQLESYGSAENAPIYEASCREDGWSRELATCLLQRGYYDPMNQCSTEAPGWVFQQIQARIDKRATAKK